MKSLCELQGIAIPIPHITKVGPVQHTTQTKHNAWFFSVHYGTITDYDLFYYSTEEEGNVERSKVLADIKIYYAALTKTGAELSTDIPVAPV